MEHHMEREAWQAAASEKEEEELKIHCLTLRMALSAENAHTTFAILYTKSSEREREQSTKHWEVLLAVVRFCD